MSDIKKVAFCWFGQYRSMDIAFPMNVENINQYDVAADHFYSVWNERGQSKRQEEEVGYILDSSKDKITNFNFEKLWTFTNGYIHLPERYSEFGINTEYHVSRHPLSDNLAFNSMIMHFKSFINDIKNKEYDLVILLRCDMLYKFNLNSIVNYQIGKKELYVSMDPTTDTINDTLFMARPKAMISFINDLEYGIGSSHEDWRHYIEQKGKIIFKNEGDIPKIKMKQELIHI